jgi:uncharacterized protein with FMN-binding domain
MSDSQSSSRRARLGFAGLLTAVVAVVATKAGTQPARDHRAALAFPAAAPSTSPGPAESNGPANAAPSSSASSASSGPRTVLGDTVDTRYGPVRVRLTMRGTKITDVVAVELPSSQRRDLEINSYAVPELRQEVLDAQSAAVDTVSGASYTSEGYARSVQSALDRARG